MMQSGPVYIVDDDIDDHAMVKEIWEELGLPNQLLFFTSALDVYEHLKKVERAPFIIICDVNLPKMDGFELREKILESENKKFKSVPFIFWSSNASDAQITRAYDLSAHGFFIKGVKFDEVKRSFKCIIDYWSMSRMPNK
jgi:CheY-like chemotaxis protein